MQNIFDPPYASPLIERFIENATAQIADTHEGKQWLFLGDTDHRQPGIFDFIYSCAMISKLAGMNIKHLFVELPVSQQVFINALLSGCLTPEQYAATVGVFDNRFRASKLIETNQNLTEAEGYRNAHENGITVHCADTSAGLIKRGEEKKYHYQTSRRNRLWLDYILDHPEFFSDPDSMAITVIKATAPAYKKKHDFDLFRIAGTKPPQHIIFSCWSFNNLGKTYQDYTRYVDNKAVDAASTGSDWDAQWIKKRLNADQGILESMQKTVGTDRAAVLYGFAHVRFKGNPGLPRTLDKSQYTVCPIIDDPDVDEYFANVGGAQTIEPDDLCIFTRQLETARGKDLSPSTPKRSNRLGLALAAAPR